MSGAPYPWSPSWRRAGGRPPGLGHAHRRGRDRRQPGGPSGMRSTGNWVPGPI